MTDAAPDKTRQRPRRRRGGKRDKPLVPKVSDVDQMTSAFAEAITTMVCEMATGMAKLMQTMVDAAYMRGRNDQFTEMRDAQENQRPLGKLKVTDIPINRIDFTEGGGPTLGASAAAVAMRTSRSAAPLERDRQMWVQ